MAEGVPSFYICIYTSMRIHIHMYRVSTIKYIKKTNLTTSHRGTETVKIYWFLYTVYNTFIQYLNIYRSMYTCTYLLRINIHLRVICNVFSFWLSVVPLPPSPCYSTHLSTFPRSWPPPLSSPPPPPLLPLHSLLFALCLHRASPTATF